MHLPELALFFCALRSQSRFKRRCRPGCHEVSKHHADVALKFGEHARQGPGRSPARGALEIAENHQRNGCVGWASGGLGLCIGRRGVGREQENFRLCVGQYLRKERPLYRIEPSLLQLFPNPCGQLGVERTKAGLVRGMEAPDFLFADGWNSSASLALEVGLHALILCRSLFLE